MDKDKITVLKTNRGFTAIKGDIRASFDTETEAKAYAREHLPHFWYSPTGILYDDREVA